MGLKKKISELCTLCDVKACLIVYGSDGDCKTPTLLNVIIVVIELI